MKIACVLIPHFLLNAEIHRSPTLKGKFIVIVGSNYTRRTVVDFSPELDKLQVGMPLEEALSIANGATLIEEDNPYYIEIFTDLLASIEQRSPMVEEASMGCIYVGLDGLDGIYGGENMSIKVLQGAIPNYLVTHIGVGNGKFIARVAAVSAAPGHPIKAPNDLRTFMNKLSVDVLPVNCKTKSRLHGFALHTLGDISNLSIGPLQAQFGREGELIWKLANGIDNSPLIPSKVEETVQEILTFPTPMATLDNIVMGADTLIRKAFLRPELKNRYVRQIHLEGRVYANTNWIKKISFKKPAGNPRNAMLRIKNVLEGSFIPGPLEDITLTLSMLTGESGRQGNFFSAVRKHEQLRESINQLEILLGKPPPIFQVREVEPWSRIPERRHALVQYVP